ncbi:hypothetical protein [uncultured Jannaschia sp.]|uniref:hypothetical protein n=1 Tax=uncultured Jannaschia sp. TaxID=293347 RepID=UPI0026292BB5|nr:hypothetical protein [uncultured Jannaschia sp.]
MRTSTKLFAVAIAAEVILISTGLGLATVQAAAAYASHANLTLAASAAAFPLLLAVLELFKIPAGVSLYTARWTMKPFAALLLVGGTVATFETVTMAGSTWFRALQFEITAQQSELASMRERRDGAGDRTSQVADIRAALEALERQRDASTETPAVEAAEARFDELTAEIEALLVRQSDARAMFGADWDSQTDNNSARIDSGNPSIAEQGLASQRSMPTRQAYIDARMEDWAASEGRLLDSQIQELQAERNEARDALETARLSSAEGVAAILENLDRERTRLQNLMQAMANDRQAQDSSVDLGGAIAARQQEIARLAEKSVIYDIAAKAYGVAIHEVSEEQANVVTFWVVLGVGLSAALSTGLAAFLAAYLAQQTRPEGYARTLRTLAAKRKRLLSQEETIAMLRRELQAMKDAPPKLDIRERIVYRHLPIERELLDPDMPVRLKGRTREIPHAA